MSVTSGSIDPSGENFIQMIRKFTDSQPSFLIQYKHIQHPLESPRIGVADHDKRLWSRIKKDVENYEKWLKVRSQVKRKMYLPPALQWVLSIHSQHPLQFFGTCNNLFGTLLDLRGESDQGDWASTNRYWNEVYGYDMPYPPAEDTIIQFDLDNETSLEERFKKDLILQVIHSNSSSFSAYPTPAPGPADVPPWELKAITRSRSSTQDKQGLITPMNTVKIKTTNHAALDLAQFQVVSPTPGNSPLMKDVNARKRFTMEPRKKLNLNEFTASFDEPTPFTFPVTDEEKLGFVWIFAISKWDYHSPDGHLSIKEGEGLRVIDRESEKWYGVETLDGHSRGWYPSTYCQLIRRFNCQ
ncbi:hypothetical protein PROFUN_08058 [Planoprotostelium fungivorum]|uniref:SH3 domain-containing protein n=1 Tax=Planoprotostelium fungivorum TaxID=1890364 RepID=A0A2P6NKK6_9EUKA|nr:hypothetical protein PROFUN_08058 [Planoprotostelium fungivorum]